MFKRLSGKVSKFLFSGVSFLLTLALGTAVAHANVGYNGQPWSQCVNQRVATSRAIYSGSRYMGTVTLYRCNNGFFTRTASAVGAANVTAETRQNRGGYIQAVSQWGYATISNMVPAMPGFCFTGTGIINGAGGSVTYCI